MAYLVSLITFRFETSHDDFTANYKFDKSELHDLLTHQHLLPKI